VNAGEAIHTPLVPCEVGGDTSAAATRARHPLTQTGRRPAGEVSASGVTLVRPHESAEAQGRRSSGHGSRISIPQSRPGQAPGVSGTTAAADEHPQAEERGDQSLHAHRLSFRAWRRSVLLLRASLMSGHGDHESSPPRPDCGSGSDGERDPAQPFTGRGGSGLGSPVTPLGPGVGAR
jgi:hypothetical protein